MFKFKDRLKELREEQGLSQVQLAKATGISRTALSYYEAGLRVPSIDAAAVLADFFKVSVDYLIGRED